MRHSILFSYNILYEFGSESSVTIRYRRHTEVYTRGRHDNVQILANNDRRARRWQVRWRQTANMYVIEFEILSRPCSRVNSRAYNKRFPSGVRFCQKGCTVEGRKIEKILGSRRGEKKNKNKFTRCLNSKFSRFLAVVSFLVTRWLKHTLSSTPAKTLRQISYTRSCYLKHRTIQRTRGDGKLFVRLYRREGKKIDFDRQLNFEEIKCEFAEVDPTERFLQGVNLALSKWPLSNFLWNSMSRPPILSSNALVYLLCVLLSSYGLCVNIQTQDVCFW